jgi:hypothetical protein
MRKAFRRIGIRARAGIFEIVLGNVMRRSWCVGLNYGTGREISKRFTKSVAVKRGYLESLVPESHAYGRLPITREPIIRRDKRVK